MILVRQRNINCVPKYFLYIEILHLDIAMFPTKEKAYLWVRIFCAEGVFFEVWKRRK